MSKFSLWRLALAFGLTAPALLGAAALEREAELYAQGTQRLLFTLKAVDKDGLLTRHYREASGADAVIETVELKDGRPTRYVYDQRQMGDMGEARVEGKQLVLSYSSRGKTKTAKEALPKNLLFGPMITHFAAEHWSELMAGKSVVATVPVLSRERLMTARLAFFRDPQREASTNERVIVMKPASWFVALFLAPDYLTFSADGNELKRISGPTLLKTRKGDDFVNTDCDVIYGAS